MNIKLLVDALRVGQQVADPATWKNSGTTIATVTGILGSLFALLAIYGIQIDATKEELQGWAGAIVALGSLFHIIWTKITSKKVGVPGMGPAKSEK